MNTFVKVEKTIHTHPKQEESRAPVSGGLHLVGGRSYRSLYFQARDREDPGKESRVLSGCQNDRSSFQGGHGMSANIVAKGPRVGALLQEEVPSLE